MTFDQLFVLSALGAFAIVVALVGWAVNSTRALSSSVAVLISDMAAVVARVASLEGARDEATRLMTAVSQDVAYIRGLLETRPNTQQARGRAPAVGRARK